VSVLLKVKYQLINLETTVPDSDLDLPDSAPLLPLTSGEPGWLSASVTNVSLIDNSDLFESALAMVILEMKVSVPVPLRSLSPVFSLLRRSGTPPPGLLFRSVVLLPAQNPRHDESGYETASVRTTLTTHNAPESPLGRKPAVDSNHSS